MEFWLDKSKIAYTAKPIGTVSFALDVWEESSLVGLPFKHTASFTIETDARVYLAAKYPHAVEKIIVEKITNADQEVAASLSVERPTPPHDLRDDDAWRKYRDDSRRFRAAISEDANALVHGSNWYTVQDDRDGYVRGPHNRRNFKLSRAE